MESIVNTRPDSISFEKQIIMTLKASRQSKKITQTELANRIGVSRDTIARIESGKARIYLAQAEAMADALDMELRDLMRKEKQKEGMTVIDENMSVSRQDTLVTYLPQKSDGSKRQGKVQSQSKKYFFQSAAELYGEPMKDYILNHRSFWSWVPEDKLADLSISSVVEATLRHGESQDARWLFDTIGVDKAAKLFRRQIIERQHGYPKTIEDYFEAYFARHAPETSE